MKRCLHTLCIGGSVELNITPLKITCRSDIYDSCFNPLFQVSGLLFSVRIKPPGSVSGESSRAFCKLENKYPGKKCQNGGDVQPFLLHTGNSRVNQSVNDNGSDAHAWASLRGHPENGEKYGIHNIKYDTTIVTIYPVLCILNFLL